eukprot:202325-Pleurochrysis_carterae.AAC.6
MIPRLNRYSDRDRGCHHVKSKATSVLCENVMDIACGRVRSVALGDRGVSVFIAGRSRGHHCNQQRAAATLAYMKQA